MMLPQNRYHHFSSILRRLKLSHFGNSAPKTVFLPSANLGRKINIFTPPLLFSGSTAVALPSFYAHDHRLIAREEFDPYVMEISLSHPADTIDAVENRNRLLP